MPRYVTRALVIIRDDRVDEQIIGGETVFEPTERAVKTGLFSADGYPLWRLPDTVPMGFHAKEPAES